MCVIFQIIFFFLYQTHTQRVRSPGGILRGSSGRLRRGVLRVRVRCPTRGRPKGDTIKTPHHKQHESKRRRTRLLHLSTRHNCIRCTSILRTVPPSMQNLSRLDRYFVPGRGDRHPCAAKNAPPPKPACRKVLNPPPPSSSSSPSGCWKWFLYCRCVEMFQRTNHLIKRAQCIV